MAEWRAKQLESSQPIREAAPEAVTRRMSELGNEIWTVALGMANARLSSEREALEHRRAELEANHKEAVELADSLNAELDAYKSDMTTSWVTYNKPIKYSPKNRVQISAPPSSWKLLK